jgi:hypothetical protein
VRLWTVQPIEVYRAIQKEGFARVEPVKLPSPWWVGSSYRWLIWQMGSRLSIPDEESQRGIFPWFAYCERPDLRLVRHSQVGEQVLIGFCPPADRFLSFPCWAWGEIFCGFFLAFTRQEYRAWEAKFKLCHACRYRDWDSPILPRPFQTELESSWARLFDPDIPKRSWRRGETSHREAVVDILLEDWIQKVTPFWGRNALLNQVDAYRPDSQGRSSEYPKSLTR